MEDPSVQQAFNSFKTLLLLVVPYLASVKISTLQTFKATLCSIFRHFVGSQVEFLCPEVPTVQSELYVVCLKFQQRKLDFPSFKTKDRHEDLSDEADDEGQAGGDSRNSLPHPFLLFLRSLNAWCNFLHTQHKWSAWNEHLQKLEPVHIGTRSCTLDSKVPLVLLLSCRDVEIDGGDCIYCKAADVCENPSLYSGLSDDLLQAAQAILQHSKSVTDEEAEKILGLKRDDSEGADSDPASERKGDGAAEEEGQRSPGSQEGLDALLSTRATAERLPEKD